jgi:hypothetical protein
MSRNTRSKRPEAAQKETKPMTPNKLAAAALVAAASAVATPAAANHPGADTGAPAHVRQ